MEYIQLKKDDIIRVGIKDANGKDTGEHLEFDLEDINLLLNINESEAKHTKNQQNLTMQLAVLEKKEDKKGKNMLSWKEEEKLKLLNHFFKEEEKALDLFIGKGGTKKLLNGRKPYLTMYDDIAEMLEPIVPLIKKGKDNLVDKLKKKYGNNEEEEILE